MLYFFFFFNDTATTEIYTLSLHDALPISPGAAGGEERIDIEFALGKALEDAGEFASSFEHYQRGNALHRSEEHTSELQSQSNLVCRLLLEKKKKNKKHDED